MKVLLLGPDLKLNGGVSNYYNVINLHEHQDIEYFPVNAAPSRSLLAYLKRIVNNYIIYINKLFTNRYKIVHLNPSLDIKSFYRDAIFIIIAHLFKIKTIVFFHGWQEQFENKIRNRFLEKNLFRFSFTKADVFIVLGEKFKKKLISLKVHPNKKFYIETTIVDDSYLKNFNLKEKILSFKRAITFLFLSRILKEKGIYIAIDAFHEIRKLYPEKVFEFIIAGDGPELPRVRQYVEEKKIPNVKFVGFVSGDKKYKILARAHILLFPTFYGEGLPTCILEAMLYGIPVVSRIAASIPDWVVSGVNGFLSKSTDYKDFIPLIQKLIDDQCLYEKTAKNNHETAKQYFTKNKVKSRILNLYHSLN